MTMLRACILAASPWFPLALPLSLVLFVLVLLTACGAPRTSTRPPSATITAGPVSLTQSGAAASPASARSKTRTATVTLPAGTSFEINDRLGTFTATLGAPAALLIETRDDTATGPAAFTPPAPPSPVEEAAGLAAKWCWGLMLGGAILAGLGVYWRGPLVIAGGVIVAGAGAFGLFVASHPWIIAVGGVGALLAAGGFTAWQLWIKPGAWLRRPSPSLPAAESGRL